MTPAQVWSLKVVYILAVAVLYGQEMYDLGVRHTREEPKKCAVVPGEQVVSTLADSCTYANAFGRATTKRRAG